MSYTNLLFDLDGTLTDPKLGITKSVQYALAKMNIVVDSLDDLDIFIGPPLRVSFKDYYQFDEAKIEAAVDYYREYFSVTGLFENAVFPGVREILDRLSHDPRMRLFIATSKPEIYAKQILDHYELSSYFEYICGSELDGARSAKAEIIGYLMETYDLQPEQTVMIGDRKHDIIGAQQQKIDSIAVGFGYGSEEELRLAEPTHIVNSVEELNHFLTLDHIQPV
ncbi:HAD family hydrolase [Paenibacillus provencensis]|uniref:HAD family hydrolase n=1 Tax=Paenibacillus provencensis TaxID=441151 RepID=A0ABW3PRT3_9BACL|nr:HAD family hydrolase [Paenibacillus sp. MER 78]MCM3126932.1 HAD family hydrolase [Paenibacillus sp. MER 78]